MSENVFVSGVPKKFWKEKNRADLRYLGHPIFVNKKQLFSYLGKNKIETFRPLFLRQAAGTYNGPFWWPFSLSK